MIADVVAGACLAGAAVLLWPRVRPWQARRRRSRALGRQHPVDAGVPEALELLALAMSGGADLHGALSQVARSLGGEQGRELASVAAGLAWGLDDAAVWDLVPPRWEPARRAVLLASTAGVPPAGLLRDAAADLRRDALARVEAATARLSVRLVVPLGLAFLPAFVLTTVVPVVLALAGGLVLTP